MLPYDKLREMNNKIIFTFTLIARLNIYKITNVGCMSKITKHLETMTSRAL